MELRTVERFLQRMEQLRGTPYHQLWAWLAESAGVEFNYQED